MPDGSTKRPSKSDRSKADLIAATSRSMRERDTIDVSLSEIAEASGMNAALVKYHFGNKEGLMFAVLEADVRKAHAALAALLGRQDLGPEDMMRRHLCGLVQAYRQVPYLSKLMYALTRNGAPERVQRIVDDMVEPTIHAQSRILERGHALGIFRKVDARSFYFASLGAARSMYAQRFTLAVGFGVEQITDGVHRDNLQEIVTLLMNGILLRGPGEVPS